MNKINYQRELDKITENLSKTGETPVLLLHACCAPCSSYCLEYLSQYFKIYIYFYNPNISDKEEYLYRLDEEKRLISQMNFKNSVELIESEYDSKDFFKYTKGLEKEPEGGARCKKCFELRLEKTAQKAKELSVDYFTTTLTISPLKNAQLLNEIGIQMAEKYGVKWLYSDFKKKEGYKRSIELSKIYNLYRQDYCGCVFSKLESSKRKEI